MHNFNPNSIEISRGHFIDGTLVAGGNEKLPVRRPSDNQIYVP